MIQLIKAARAGRSQADMQSEPRISPQAYSDFLIKQELLPVTNYLPDVEGIKQSGVNVIMAAGQESLDKKRWYAETSQILAQRLGCELAVFPGHHGSFMDMPEPWAQVLRNILHKAEAVK